MKWIFFYSFLLLTSCAAIHNTPLSETPNTKQNPNIIYSFVDQNGNFYPKNWKSTYGEPPENAKKNDYSLKKIATEKKILNQLTKEEESILNNIKEESKNKKRIFIFVHGFNSTAKKSTKNYELARKHININPQTDQVIQFYWDGLAAKNKLSGAKIWFHATDFSQMAGEFGLRKILNILKNKEIYIISHSRGASVVISALTSESLSEREKKNTTQQHNIDFETSNKLQENNNIITCIMLAPAIGINDFYQDIKSEEFCEISPQIKKIHITINNSDLLLKKFVGFLSKTLIPTDLGFKEDAYNKLCEHYSLLEKTDFTGQKRHDFESYINNPKFKEILKTYQLNR